MECTTEGVAVSEHHFVANADFAINDGRQNNIDESNGADNIWSQPLNGEPRKPVTNFRSDSIFSFAWSQDGKRLAISRGPVTTDVVPFIETLNRKT